MCAWAMLSNSITLFSSSIASSRSRLRGGPCARSSGDPARNEKSLHAASRRVIAIDPSPRSPSALLLGMTVIARQRSLPLAMAVHTGRHRDLLLLAQHIAFAHRSMAVLARHLVRQVLL